MYWYIVHLKVYIVYTLYLESRHVILPFWKLLPVDGFKPTMHAVQQMVVWHSLHGSVYRSEASEIHESSCLATRKDILTCWNSRPCDDAWLPIFDLFWVQPRTRQRWCCREGGSIHAIVASQQGPHEWQGHDGCPTPTSRCLCLDLADAVRFVCPKSNETLLTPGDIATSTRISLYKGSYIGSFILTQFIWTSGISLRSRFPRYDQSFCPDQKSVLRTEKIERHEKAQKTVSVRFTCEFLLTWLWHPAFIWWNGPLLMHLWPGMPGSMGGNTPIGMAMGGHMTEQMEDQIRNMMQQVLMPFQDQVMSKLCSVEENLHRQLDGVLATHDAIYIYTRRIWIIYTHGHMWLNFLHFRARIREIHSQRKRQPQIDVNPRLSNSGIPVFPNKWPVANRLYRIRCALRFSRGHCSAYGFLAGGHFTDGERMPSPAAQVGFIPGRVSNGKYWWNGMTGTVPGDVFLEDTFFLWCFFGFNCEFFLSLLPLRSDEFERIPWFRGWTRRRQWWTTFLAASQANKWETSSQASLSNFKMTLCLIHHYITHSQSFKSSLHFPGSTWHLILSPQGATDNTKQALMETVNSSSSVLLQKLDLTQQDLLKQSKARNPVVTATKKRPLVNLKPEKNGGHSPRFKDSLVFDRQLSCDEIRNMIVHHRVIFGHPEALD